jgi:Galactose oxidase, central domain/FlgD Ig-like domain
MKGRTPERLAALSLAVLALTLPVKVRSASPDGTWIRLDGFTGRSSFAMAYDAPRGRCVVFGGVSSGGAYLNESWAFDPAQNTWTALDPLGPAPSPRANYASAMDSLHHRLVVFAGDDASGRRSDVWTLTLDAPAHWDSIPVAGGPGPRSQAVAVYDPVRDRIIIFGGLDSQSNSQSDVWELRIGPTPAWTLLYPDFPEGNGPAGTYAHRGFYDPVRDRIVYYVLADTTQVFALDLTDPPAWHLLHTAGDSPAARGGSMVAYDPTQDRLVLHGGIASPGGYMDDTWALSLAGTPTWTAIAHIGPGYSGWGRAFGGGGYDPVGQRFVIAGGQYFNGIPPARRIADTYGLSMAPGSTWQVLAQPKHLARLAPATAYDSGRHQLLLILGAVSGTTDVDVLNLSAMRPVWQELGYTMTPPATLAGASGVFDRARDRMLVFGGQDGNAYSATVWTHDRAGPQVFSTLATTGAPPAGRRDASVVLDEANNRLILYGGRDASGAFSDLWALSLGTTPTWIQLAASVPAGARYGHSAAVDASNARMVVFGGRSSTVTPALGDVWAMSLSGSPTWTALTPSGTPPAGREYHSAVVDAARHRMVVYGGEAGAGPFGDLWSLSLDGLPAWTALSPAGPAPPARYSHAAVWAPEFDAMVIADGYGAAGALDDSWKLAASSILVSVPETPAPAAAFTAPWPDPASASVTLAFTLARAGEARLEVFDLAGRRVRRLASGTMTAGPHQGRWDLRDETGRAVPSGVYLARFTAPGASGIRRLVVLR